MKLARILVLPLVLAATFSHLHAETQKLQVGDITISYPAELEPQAKELAKVAPKVITPRREKLLTIHNALSDTKGAVKRITDLMGCPECAQTPTEVLSAFRTLTTFYQGFFTDLRLYRDTDLMSRGGITEGDLQVTYDPETGKADVSMESRADQAMEGSAFLPLPVGTDGRFPDAGMSLHDSLVEHYDCICWSACSPLHEAAENILLNDLGFSHPFSRWFNEGVATWVELRVADQLLPSRLSREHKKQSFAGQREKSLKGKVNLMAWPLAPLESQCLSAEEEEISATCYSFALEAIDRMLGDKPGALAKVTAKLKGGRSPDTDKICAAITEVTGRDAKSILLDYVPDYVRAGLKSGEPESLREDALQKLHARDYAGGAKLLSRLLEMTPSNVNARLDLARAMRKSGAPKSESERMIIIAVMVLQSSEVRKFELCASDADSKYVAARALQVAGDKQNAKAKLEQVLKLDPGHADALSALKELESASPK